MARWTARGPSHPEGKPADRTDMPEILCENLIPFQYICIYRCLGLLSGRTVPSAWPVFSLCNRSGCLAKRFCNQCSYLGSSWMPPVVVPTGQLGDERVPSSTTQRLEEVGKAVGDVGDRRGYVRVRLTAVHGIGFRAGPDVLRRSPTGWFIR